MRLDQGLNLVCNANHIATSSCVLSCNSAVHSRCGTMSVYQSNFWQSTLHAPFPDLRCWLTSSWYASTMTTLRSRVPRCYDYRCTVDTLSESALRCSYISRLHVLRQYVGLLIYAALT